MKKYRYFLGSVLVLAFMALVTMPVGAWSGKNFEHMDRDCPYKCDFDMSSSDDSSSYYYGGYDDSSSYDKDCKYDKCKRCDDSSSYDYGCKCDGFKRCDDFSFDDKSRDDFKKKKFKGAKSKY